MERLFDPGFVGRLVVGIAVLAFLGACVALWLSRRTESPGWLRAGALLTGGMAIYAIWAAQSWVVGLWGLDSVAGFAGLGLGAIALGAAIGRFMGALWRKTD